MKKVKQRLQELIYRMALIDSIKDHGTNALTTRFFRFKVHQSRKLRTNAETE